MTLFSEFMTLMARATDVESVALVSCGACGGRRPVKMRANSPTSGTSRSRSDSWRTRRNPVAAAVGRLDRTELRPLPCALLIELGGAGDGVEGAADPAGQASLLCEDERPGLGQREVDGQPGLSGTRPDAPCVLAAVDDCVRLTVRARAPARPIRRPCTTASAFRPTSLLHQPVTA